MPILVTLRTLLVPLTRDMIQTRLAQNAFELQCAGPGGPLPVRFTPEWPGDALPLFPSMVARLRPDQQEVDPDRVFTLITRDTTRAIGQLGTNGSLSGVGEIEIGYGVIPAARGQGYASEGVGALVAHLHTLPGVCTVVASTSVANRASERVLEHAGFVRTGSGWNEDDGDLTTWAHRRPEDR